MYSLLLIVLSTMSSYGMQISQPIAGQLQASLPQMPQIVFVVSPQAQSQFSPVYTPTINMNQQAIQQTEQNVIVTQTTLLLDTAQKVAQEAVSLYKHFSATLWDHKWLCCATIAALAYGTGAYLCMADTYYMGSTNLWCHWYESKSLEELCALPHETLAKELVLAIQSRYVNTLNPTDCITPLSNFISDLNAEEKRLKQCRSRANFISRLYLQKIIPCARNTGAQAQQLLERLAFIRHIFTSWAAECNWQQTARCTKHMNFHY
jgi:hypothetical protein